MTRDDVERERLAIALESGVPEGRAREIARCEGEREAARLVGLPWWCRCKAHETGPRRHEDAI